MARKTLTEYERQLQVFPRLLRNDIVQDWGPGVFDSGFWGGEGDEPLEVERIIHRAVSTRMRGWHMAPIYRKHLPRDGLILEAGCGWGHVVAALRALGYNCVGVDYSDRRIELGRKAVPDLPIEKGDIYNLKWSDGELAAYVSLGVVEHNVDGPQAALREAFRVLRRGGVILVSVPYANPFRRFKAKLGMYPYDPPAGDYRFFQYLYSRTQLRQYVQDAGFRVAQEYSIDAPFGLQHDWRMFRRLALLSRVLYRTASLPLRYLPPLRVIFGHSQVCVASKP